MEALTEHGLVAETASGTFSFKNKITSASIKTLWDKLSRFITDALRQQKGVLVPNLGTFSVGPVVGEARKKVRPAFTLLETRYAGVSQERPKYSLGGRCPVLQPNYGLLATASAVHRGACQRLVLELMQRLGVHILSGRPISVLFPGVGRLFTNKAGRIQFEFDQLLREFFELERERVIPEMPYEDAAASAEVVRALQQVHLHNPPAIKSRPTTGASSAAPQASPPSRVKRAAGAPYSGALLDLWRLCKSNDRINSGCVPRLQLEQWLYKECAALLRQLAAATVLELLATNTYGKTGKHILYKPFLDQMEAAIGAMSPRELSPRPVRSPRPAVEDSPSHDAQGRDLELQLDAAYQERDVAEVTLSPVGQGHHPPQARHPPPPLTLPQTPGVPTPAWQEQAPEAAVPHHYFQNQLSPRSRREYDNFNRLHFEKLEQARGRDYKRAVTPKVGEDLLNQREYLAIRHTGDAVTPASVLGGMQDDRPYSRDTGKDASSAPRRRASPGPRPQILTLAHDTPSPSPSPYIPGLPTHFYQPQQQQQQYAGTPQQRPSSSRQPTPSQDGPSPISQYDIINELDPVLRQRKRSELAHVLQRNWSEQIQEKERVLQEIAVAESQWPYVPVRHPNDKRPSSAVSRQMSRGSRLD
ncbi:hypothetical protein Agub_g2070 [Astrephomene gubernaculifera]|uniref:CCDC81 HU domain-containing protein n=1 Tax=Astrephomene gubernaculifera TaxID=47775 RepID=A0AAD3DIL0_9CHLO|nr:hypothetical protein Agub_g2070 [Astrephomene gubernaculifera]